MDRHIKQLPTSSTISNNAWIPYSENGKALKKMTKINMFGDKTLEKPLNHWYENEHLFYRRRVSATPSKETASKVQVNSFDFRSGKYIKAKGTNGTIEVTGYWHHWESLGSDYYMAFCVLPKPVDEIPSGTWNGDIVVFASTGQSGLQFWEDNFTEMYLTKDDPNYSDYTMFIWSDAGAQSFDAPPIPPQVERPTGFFYDERYGSNNKYQFGCYHNFSFNNTFAHQGVTFYYPDIKESASISNPFYGTNPGPEHGTGAFVTLDFKIPTVNYEYDHPGHNIPGLADDWYQDVDVKIYSTYADMYADGWASVDELNQYNYGKAVEYMITHEVEVIDISNHYFQLDNAHDNPVFDYPFLYGENANDAGIELVRFWVSNKGEANFHQMLVNGQPLDIPHSLDVNFTQELTSGYKIGTVSIIENGGLPKSIDDVYVPDLEMVDHIQSEAEIATIALGTHVGTLTVPKLPAAEVKELYSASSYSDSIALNNVPDVYDMLQIVVCNPDINTDLTPSDHTFTYMKDELGSNVMLELGTRNYDIQVKCLMAFGKIAGLSVQNHTYATPYIRKVYALRYN